MKRRCINSHFNLETRKLIETFLDEGKTVSDIAKILKRDRSNISREILKHRELKLPSNYGSTSTCIHKDYCKSRKFGCDDTCSNYEIDICIKLKASPHVCNPCSTKSCRKAKYYYSAQIAEEQYSNTLKNSRNSMHYTDQELAVINNDLYFLFIQNKSLYHSVSILNNEGYNFNVKTIYRQIKADKLNIKPSDLPRLHKVKKTKIIDTNYKRNIDGHTYEDFLILKNENNNLVLWQMDCVQGIQGADEQVFLTLELVDIKFLFIFIIPHHTFEEVKKKLQYFIGILSLDKTNTLIELLLTDNGKEFIKLEELIEILNTNNIFYCHPYCSFEKGEIENNHELIRRVIPKGVSLSIYNQQDINLLCSHINSLYRKSLNGKCPFDLINNYLSDKTLSLLGYHKIKPRDVKLIPELIGDKNINNIKKYLSKNDIKKANINFIKKD